MSKRMTKEEAIELLSAYGVPQDEKRFQEAIDMAIKALRRETPKNPVTNLVSDADGTRRLEEGWTEDAILCPVCHTYFGSVYNEGYCRQCGQKLIQKRVRVIEE